MSTVPATNQQILFNERPRGMPGANCFKLVTVPLKRPGAGEVLVRNHLLSVDPYIRMRMEEKDSYAPVMAIGDVMVGRTAGEIVESRADGFAVGDWVVGRLGWQSYSCVKPGELQKLVRDANITLG
jgi:NADPH-dependent curcumin reductase CurA